MCHIQNTDGHPGQCGESRALLSPELALPLIKVIRFYLLVAIEIKTGLPKHPHVGWTLTVDFGACQCMNHSDTAEHVQRFGLLSV